MRWVIKTKFTSLDEAVKSPNRCRTLNLLFIKKTFKDSGSSLVKLRNLRELHIQGDPSIYDDYEFSLPSEIGELTELRKLTLLNLPITIWPGWIWKLKKLEYLMIRGTDINVIPSEISQLSLLTTLRIENCPLTNLPPELARLRKLKNLGLSDSKLTMIEKSSLPSGLRKINLPGTALFSSIDKVTEKTSKIRLCWVKLTSHSKLLKDL